MLLISFGFVVAVGVVVVVVETKILIKHTFRACNSFLFFSSSFVCFFVFVFVKHLNEIVVEIKKFCKNIVVVVAVAVIKCFNLFKLF